MNFPDETTGWRPEIVPKHNQQDASGKNGWSASGARLQLVLTTYLSLAAEPSFAKRQSSNEVQAKLFIESIRRANQKP
jgi:hypothetical protein